MNILILSCGTRNKLMRYFKENLHDGDRLYAADCSPMAPALYEADKYFIIPNITEPDYLTRIIDICSSYNINAVLSLIDPELSLLADNKQKFLDVGTIPIVSDSDVVELCFNKTKMMKKLGELGFNVIRTYSDKNDFYNALEKKEIDFPVIIKPIRGSASIDVHKVYSRETVEALYMKSDEFMIQEYISGTEYGADVYIDTITGEMVSLFIKEKLKMRSGETDKAVSVKNDDIVKLITDLTDRIRFSGVIDVDIFESEGKYYVIEVNPRFGGGFPHAYECGVNHIRLMLNNIAGIKNEANIGGYDEGICMMKYSDVIIKNRAETEMAANT